MVPESSEESKDINISIKWEDGTIPDAFGNDKKKLTIKGANVVVTASDVVLVKDVAYTNHGKIEKNFINDDNCHVKAYQNGGA